MFSIRLSRWNCLSHGHLQKRCLHRLSSTFLSPNSKSHNHTSENYSSAKLSKKLWLDLSLNYNSIYRFKTTKLIRFLTTFTTPNKQSPPIVHGKYDDDYIKGILREVKTIAMIGASSKWNRPSYFAMSYLQHKGYRVIPVNPGSVGSIILGEEVYASLADIPETLAIDMVDVFRKSEETFSIVQEVIDRGCVKVLWLQLGVFNQRTATAAEETGLRVVMDRCPKIEFSRLFGELGWHGFNSGVISSRRRPLGKASEGSFTAAPQQIEYGFDTKSIHSGSMPEPSTGARSTPIFQTTSYVFHDAEHAASLFNLQTFGNIYSRLSNPTTAVLEERIAALEGGRGTTCTASGHAAQLLCLFTLMQAGDKLVASNKLYGGSITQFGKTITKFGWECIFVDADDHAAVRDAVADPRVKLLWVESLANPGGVISDIEALAKLAHDGPNRIPLVIDNTLATPYLCRPIEYGADLVVHSTTKFMSGHGNAMGGALVDSGNFDFHAAETDGGAWKDATEAQRNIGKFPSLTRPEPAYHGLTFLETFGDLAFTMFGHAVGLRDLGPTMAPLNAFLTITGTETLGLRMQRHVDNAATIATFLDKHPAVAWVSYAGLTSSKYHSLARKYLPKGAGSVFTFGLHGGYEAGIRCVERCNLFSHLANIGDTRSLILHPASTTHRQLTSSQREASGAGDDTIRISIGLETVSDLKADLENALCS